MRGAGGYGRDASRLAAAKRRLLRAAALGALASSGGFEGMGRAPRQGRAAQRIPGVTTNNVQGNEFATDLRYRGFAASPLQGTPQGLAVYMQGIRVNEAFGDTVNWDLIPKVAIGRSDIWTNNPTFGLNALG